MPDYANVQFSRHWPDLTVALNELSSRYTRQDRPEAAAIVIRAWEEARRAQLLLAREMAAFATEELRRQERQTRVRPDTHGQGGPRLSDYLRADIMPGQDLLPGAVGVANYDELDKNVPWWVTNEVGSTTQVGRRIFGLFMGPDGAEPPDASASRVHPIFQPTPARAGGGPGLIQQGIPERRFIQRAVPVIDREWHMRFAAIKARLMEELRRAAVTLR